MGRKTKFREFQIGDRVKLVPPRAKKWDKWRGIVTTVVGPLEVRSDGYLRHRVAVTDAQLAYQPYVHPSFMRLVYDGGRAAEWSDSVWRPTKETV